MGARLANASRDPAAASDTGTCQVRAPVVAQAHPFPVSLFPVTQEGRRCGEWKPIAAGGPDGGEHVDVQRLDSVVVPLRSVA